MKSDVEALLAPRSARFRRGRASGAASRARSRASIVDGAHAGWIGELHPRWQQKYDLPLAPVLFELDYDAIAGRGLPAYKEISEIPAGAARHRRRWSTRASATRRSWRSCAGSRRRIVAEIALFDIYRGTGVEEGKKSLAFRVLLQDTRKTLTDAEVESAVSQLRADTAAAISTRSSVERGQ